MKKTILLIICIVSICGLVLISLFHDNSTYFVTTVPKAYSFVSTYYDSDELEIILYVSDKKSVFTNTEAINNCYITDNENHNSIKIDLKEIKDLSYSEKIKNQKFYLFSYLFDIKQFVLDEFEVSINNAILSIETEAQNFNINIGSFYYYKLPYFGDENQNLSISKLVPILSNLKGNKTLGAINLKITNHCNKDIEIVSLKLFDCNVYPAINDIIITKEEVNTKLSLSSILGYNYELTSDIYNDNIDLSLVITSNDVIELVVPLKYFNSYNINTLGFKIEYRIIGNNDNNIYPFYYDDFVYFTSNNYFIDEDTLQIDCYERN